MCWHHTLPMFCSFHQHYWMLSTKKNYAPPSYKPKMFSGDIWRERHIWFLPLFCSRLKNELCKNYIAFLFRYMVITPSFPSKLIFSSCLSFTTWKTYFFPKQNFSSTRKYISGKKNYFFSRYPKVTLSCRKKVLFPTTANLLISRKIFIKIFTWKN